MKLLSTASIALAAMATSAFAEDKCDVFGNQGACATAVPEISALEGTAAIAALAAIVLIAWERRRRAV